MNQASRFFLGALLLIAGAYLLRTFQSNNDTLVAIGSAMASGAAVVILGQVLKELIWPPKDGGSTTQ